jgi:hypothetical protein
MTRDGAQYCHSLKLPRDRQYVFANTECSVSLEIN